MTITHMKMNLFFKKWASMNMLVMSNDEKKPKDIKIIRMFTFMLGSQGCHLIQQRQTLWSIKTIVSLNFLILFHACAATKREGGTGECFRAGTRVFGESSLETNGQIRDREKVGIHYIHQ